ncbi:hypothetical protein E1263_27700 [Kribbella antibiotica]|uniref:Thioredoxin-like fold domain-containing protein n=1 Tax=Kribbella antibiotica TaxID=190195 RepID=A0A4R4Z9E5_9ACTN|nr:thioredoxin-like domain-containing protein [Kribbella antibiotica]TDD53749.1 hypothetical protein E1263_27700 [Kribbella antibiotica]
MTVVLTAVSLVNLLLLLGVIRRVNDLARRPVATGAASAPAPVEAPMLPAGHRLPDFRAIALDGAEVTGQELVLVGFLSQGCRQCQQAMPSLLKAAQTAPGGRARVLIVVVGDASAAQPQDSAKAHLAKLSEVAQIVVEPRNGPLSSAFKVEGFPTFYRLHSGAIAAHGDKALK